MNFHMYEGKFYADYFVNTIASMISFLRYKATLDAHGIERLLNFRVSF